jgi:cytochrome P450
MCVGQNLAYAEIYITAVAIFRRFPEMRLWDTTSKDMEYVHDYFAGMARMRREGRE